ncbi:MAG: ABC transporter permease subunit [Chloroflexi bacterium]|nr:ABC transporter permease subunit [Chloroflexota bacterium]
MRVPAVVRGPAISLSPSVLALYAAFSLGRMLAAYVLSLIFALVYGRLAAYNPRAEQVLMPLLDVLQSVPILSFLPVVLLGLTSILPQGAAAEIASIVLIFTSQAWNLTFAWYQSLTTIPKELREASAIYRLGPWMRFKTLELPFAAISVVWNSMMSWAGGWFFLMAAETFTVGQRDFRLPGLGSYLAVAANQGNLTAIAWGIGTLILLIVALDQLVWRPLLAWTERFKLEMVGGDERPSTSWFYEMIREARLVGLFTDRVWRPLGEALDRSLNRRFPPLTRPRSGRQSRNWLFTAAAGIFWLGMIYGVDRLIGMLLSLPLFEWGQVGLGLLATLARVLISLLIALAWTIPVGVAIGTNPRLAGILQPIVQITASVPATALFPAFLLLVVGVTGGLNIAAVFLMLMGTQWYLLFNIIAGAAAIPQDLKYTATMLQLGRWERWRTLILPALFPYIITGAITAGGGAWNASIVAEYVQFSGKTLQTTGIGALISQATARGNYPLLLVSTLSLILTVVLINRLFWRRLYGLAESRYRME